MDSFRDLLGLPAARPEKEFTTGNNDADGVHFLHWVRRRFPEKLPMSKPNCASGAAIRRVSTSPISTIWATCTPTPCGGITPGQRQGAALSQIWPDTADPHGGPQAVSASGQGTLCGTCAYLPICNGNTRVRAQQMTGDPGRKTRAATWTTGRRRMIDGRFLAVAGLAASLPWPWPAGRASGRRPGQFQQHCAACHGADRLGGIGPALLPENLARLRKAEAEKVLREGRPRPRCRPSASCWRPTRSRLWSSTPTPGQARACLG